jgi:cobalt-zinc-cadmium efflux system outer membrane protein
MKVVKVMNVTNLMTTLMIVLCATAPLAAQAPPLTLENAVQLFLDRNVELFAARAQVDRARAEQIAARVRPNPVFTITAENLKLNGPSTQTCNRLREISTTYSETIELGGKRRLRDSVAELTLSVAERKFENVLREKLGEFKQSYFQALLARHDLDIAAENRETFEQLVRFNVARFDEGAIAEGDLLKVRLERMKFDSAVRRAELRLSQAMVEVLEKLEEPDFAVRPLAGSLDVPVTNLDLKTLIQTAFNNRPDLKAADAEIQLAGERLSLERAKASADISPFVGYKRMGPNNTLLFGVTVPLRIRDRNQGGIARAEGDEKIMHTQREVVANRVRVDVELAFRAYQAARDQVMTFRDQLLRQADESQSITLAAYQEGATELLPVLEAQRTRSEIRHQYFQTLFDYQASVLQLEVAIGGSIQP